jgi:hypothetical protein
VRKATLASLLRRAAPGLRFNEHLDNEDGPLVFEHACKMGLEGIVSKRRDSFYPSGRSPDWIKSKNPNGAGSEARSRGGLGRAAIPCERMARNGHFTKIGGLLDHLIVHDPVLTELQPPQRIGRSRHPSSSGGRRGYARVRRGEGAR